MGIRLPVPRPYEQTVRVERLPLVRAAVFELLHAGRVDASDLRTEPIEASSKRLLDTPEDVPTDKRAPEFEKCFVNVSTSLEAGA